ncbi:hypothetical protein J6590_065868 [Homalodisca vitripennis]|nr:hypothetical protein J6590_065868 [Homalodisca vitripennis]
MSCCAVATCPNNSKKTKGSEQRVVYHKFPKDSETCKIWLSKCKRGDSVNCKYAYVCSDHFAPSDYIDDMKNRLLGLPQKLLLKPFVVPSIKLPTISNDDDDVHNERIKKRRVRKNAIERLDSLSPRKSRIEPLNTDRLDESNLVQPSSVCEKCENLLEENNNLKSSIDVLEQKLTNLRREHDILYKSIGKKRKMHSKTLRRHAKTVKTLRTKLSYYKISSKWVDAADVRFVTYAVT